MTTMWDLKARFAGIPRGHFISPRVGGDSERLARVLAVPPELEGYPPDEVRAFERQEGVKFPAAFRLWMSLFGKSYVELTDWDWFMIARLGDHSERHIGSRAFIIEGEVSPRFAWFHVVRGDGGDDSPVYHVTIPGREAAMIYPSFTDYIGSEIERYEKGPGPASNPVEDSPRPEQTDGNSATKRRPWWKLF